MISNFYYNFNSRTLAYIPTYIISDGLSDSTEGTGNIPIVQKTDEQRAFQKGLDNLLGPILNPINVIPRPVA